MNIQEIEVMITGDGQVQYEVRGIEGSKCLDLTKDLETDLGGKILEREATSEMAEPGIGQMVGREADHRVKDMI